MCYLAQPCAEFSDPSHIAKIHGVLARQTKGRRSVLIAKVTAWMRY